MGVGWRMTFKLTQVENICELENFAVHETFFLQNFLFVFVSIDYRYSFPISFSSFSSKFKKKKMVPSSTY